MLKSSSFFKKYTNFTGNYFENSQDQECKVLRLLFWYGREHIGRFSHLYYCTFDGRFEETFQPEIEMLHFVTYWRKILFSVKKLSYLWTFVIFYICRYFLIYWFYFFLQSVAYPETETLISNKKILSVIRCCGPAGLFRMVFIMFMN